MPVLSQTKKPKCKADIQKVYFNNFLNKNALFFLNKLLNIEAVSDTEPHKNEPHSVHIHW